MSRGASLVEGRVGARIVSLTLPMMVGMLGMVLFNLVDTFFVGKLGTVELAAMSFTFPVVLLYGSISMGLGVGASAVIARAIGSGDRGRVQRLTTDALVLSLLIVMVLVAVGLATIDPLFRALGATGRELELLKQYMTVYYLGVPFVVIPMVGNSAIRATGNTTIPSIIMLTAVLVNVVLDPLFIFGLGPFPRMRLAGAALATVIARATTLLASLAFLKFRFDMLTTRIPRIAELLDSWKKILSIGIPAAATQAVLPLSQGVITRLIAAYGTTAVAAIGVANRIEMFALMPVSALASVVLPFTGQNLGASRIDRIHGGLRFSYLASLVVGVVSFAVLSLSGGALAAVFNRDPEVVATVRTFLLVVSAGYGFHGIVQISSSAFSALGRPLHGAAVNLIRTFGLHIPAAILLSRFFGLPGIFLGASTSAVLVGLVAVLWMRRSVTRLAAGVALRS